jgi:hypothetical protein
MKQKRHKQQQQQPICHRMQYILVVLSLPLKPPRMSR